MKRDTGLSTDETNDITKKLRREERAMAALYLPSDHGLHEYEKL